MPTKQSQIYFGGPDLKKNILRDILLDRINHSRPGSKIIWVCYYLNEPMIIESLLQAANNNIDIDIIIDENPRCPDINDNFLSALNSSNKINVFKVRLKKFWNFFGIKWNPHLHSKLYYFSFPKPHALIGSYNPTASTDHLSNHQIDEIGDHSISHNVLASISDPVVIDKLLEYSETLKSSITRNISRISLLHNHTHQCNQWLLNFLPSITKHPLNKLFLKNDNNASIKCAISHLKGPGITRPLKSALKKGKKIEIVLEASKRRISSQHLSFLDSNHINYHQPVLDNHCLMHNKFVIYKSDAEHRVMFGSFNWSTRSRFLNHEIVASTDNSEIVNEFELRWQQIISQ